MAMLRRMGFKENEGIGLKNKAVISPVLVKLYPKGACIGAALPEIDQ
jgi:hypothetical protein